MISYFPQIYPDELLYSQLARYYYKSGYMAYIFAAEDLFTNRWVRPDNIPPFFCVKSYMDIISLFYKNLQ